MQKHPIPTLLMAKMEEKIVKCKECGEEFNINFDLLSKANLCGRCSEERIKDAFGYDGDCIFP